MAYALLRPDLFFNLDSGNNEPTFLLRGATAIVDLEKQLPWVLSISDLCWKNSHEISKYIGRVLPFYSFFFKNQLVFFFNHDS